MRNRSLAPMDQLQGNSLPTYRSMPFENPRRAFKVTCAIQFSKSVNGQRLSPSGKKRTRNLLSSYEEVN